MYKCFEVPEKEVPYRCIVSLTPNGDDLRFGGECLDDFWRDVHASHAHSLYRDFVGVQRTGSDLVYIPDSPLLLPGEYKVVSRTESLDNQTLFQIISKGVSKLSGRRRLPSAKATIKQLESEFLLQFNHFSLHHEGNELSLDETRWIMDTIRSTGKHRKDPSDEYEASSDLVDLLIKDTVPNASWVDLIEARNHILVSEQLTSLARRHTITETLINGLHSCVMHGLPHAPDGEEQGGAAAAGCYRTADIEVAGGQRARPSHRDVPRLMKRFFKTTMIRKEKEPVFDFVARVHAEFQLIHPFRDGMGRMGRILINLILMKHGYPMLVLPTTLTSMFDRGVEMGHKGDLFLFTRLVAEASFRSLQVYQDALGTDLLPTASDLIDVYVVRGIPSTDMSP
jgi:hypothetical protein